MKSIIFLLLLAASPMSLIAQGNMPLYPATIPNYIDGPDASTVTNTGGIIRIANVSKPTYTFYGVQSDKPAPMVIICPGGGYRILASSHEGTDIAAKFNENGIAAMVVYYRLPDSTRQVEKQFAPLQDAQQAIRVARQHADAWKIDTNRVGIMGFSAGGHLAASAAAHFAKDYTGVNDGINLRPDFQVLIYPVITFRPFTHSGSRQSLLGSKTSEENIHLFSNEEQITAKTPKAFLVHAADDGAVPIKNALIYAENLTAARVPVDMIMYAKGGHGFGLLNKSTNDRWFDHLLTWLATNQLR